MGSHSMRSLVGDWCQSTLSILLFFHWVAFQSLSWPQSAYRSQRTLRQVLGCMSSHTISVWRMWFHFFGINTWQRDAGECGRVHRCRLCLLSAAAASSVFQLHCQSCRCSSLRVSPGSVPSFDSIYPLSQRRLTVSLWWVSDAIFVYFLAVRVALFLVCCSNTVLPIKNTSLLSF